MLRLKIHYALMIGLIWVLPLSARAEPVLQDSDTLHFDVREIVNKAWIGKQVSFRLDLCAALTQTGNGPTDRAECQLVGTVENVPVNARPNDAPFAILKFASGKQSQRKPGVEINKIAGDLREAVLRKNGTYAGAIEYRLMLSLFEDATGGSRNRLDRQFSQLPGLTITSTDPKDPNHIINRFELASADQQLRSRVLLVVTRRGGQK